MAEGKSITTALLFPGKDIEEAAGRKELRQQETDVCSFTVLGFKQLCHWTVGFPTTRLPAPAFHPNKLQVFFVCCQVVQR